MGHSARNTRRCRLRISFGPKIRKARAPLRTDHGRIVEEAETPEDVLSKSIRTCLRHSSSHNLHRKARATASRRRRLLLKHHYMVPTACGTCRAAQRVSLEERRCPNHLVSSGGRVDFLRERRSAKRKLSPPQLPRLHSKKLKLITLCSTNMILANNLREKWSRR